MSCQPAGVASPRLSLRPLSKAWKLALAHDPDNIFAELASSQDSWLSAATVTMTHAHNPAKAQQVGSSSEAPPARPRLCASWYLIIPYSDSSKSLHLVQDAPASALVAQSFCPPACVPSSVLALSWPPPTKLQEAQTLRALKDAKSTTWKELLLAAHGGGAEKWESFLLHRSEVQAEAVQALLKILMLVWIHIQKAFIKSSPHLPARQSRACPLPGS
jgi:hypothetical protein